MRHYREKPFPAAVRRLSAHMIAIVLAETNHILPQKFTVVNSVIGFYIWLMSGERLCLKKVKLQRIILLMKPRFLQVGKGLLEDNFFFR